MSEKTKLSALLEAKCPRCREGQIFKFSAFNYLKYHVTNDNCPSCGFRYEREPAFFTGAMYISYFINVACIIVFGLSVFYAANNPSLWVYFSIVFSLLLVLVPFNFRYSRVLMLYLFGGV